MVSYLEGSLNTVVVRLGECFREAVRVGAASVILVHNHPTGDPTPSPEDIQLTQEAAQAGELLDIELLDHVIVGKPDYASLREQGFYQPPARGASRGRGRTRRTVQPGERVPGAAVHA